jgi:signal transduction histidine kinase
MTDMSINLAEDDRLEIELIDALDRAAGRLPRRTLPAGTRLLTEDEPIDGIWLIFDGRVELTRRRDGHEVSLDDDASGRIIGMLSFATRRAAFFTCTAVTPVIAAKLTWERLDEVLRAERSLSDAFLIQLVRTLGGRVRHIVELQANVQRLNAELTVERDRAKQALHDLAATQTRLVESERMATLGQLVAGIAHELNNPITAIRRSVDYVTEDVSAFIAEVPDNDALLAMVTSAVTTSPLSTEELRRRREVLSRELGDEALSAKLVEIGITTLEEYHRWFGRTGGAKRASLLERLTRAHQLGTFLRNLQGAAERVSRIVGTLRSYARVQHGVVSDIDLNRTLEDTLLLFGSALRTIEVTREYGQLPQIEGDAGQLNQVWTNILSNAIEAMGGAGRLLVQTDAPDQAHVRVRITDSGPGIKPENLGRIFELNFTTKHGPSSFGLGMGLVICRQVVSRHEGRIEVDSVPGKTTFAVTLPVKLSSHAKRTIEQSNLLSSLREGSTGNTG